MQVQAEMTCNSDFVFSQSLFFDHDEALIDSEVNLEKSEIYGASSSNTVSVIF